MTVYISPYRRMSALRDSMNRMFDESFAENAVPEREMLLAVDVQSDDDAFVITALVPGLDAEDLNIEVLNNTVTLRGEFKSTEIEGSKYLISELPEGRFSRVIALPTALDTAKTEASIHNGVLNLRVPKAESHRPKAIKVTVE
jgi:HSP20 family protein